MSNNKEAVIQELVNRADPAHRNEAEKEIRKEIDYIKDFDEGTLVDFYTSKGMEIVSKTKERVTGLTALDLEQNILRAQQRVASAQGELAKQEAWNQYRSLTDEVRRRKAVQVENLRQNLVSEGNRRRALEAHAEREMAEARKSAELAKKQAQEAQERARKRADEIEILRYKQRHTRSHL